MSDQVNVAHVQQYAQIVEILLQQRGSKLSHAVMNRSYVGKAAKVVEQIGEVAVTELLSRHADTELTSVPHAARWVQPRDFGVADMVDREDLLRMLIDPTSEYATAFAYALGRQQDDLIIDAFFTDTAKTGENGTTDLSYSNDGGNVVDSSGTNPMTVDKLREAKKLLMADEVDVDNEELFVGITAQQHDDLLSQTQAISLDYNTRPVLVEGKITSFMGFNFIHCERFTLDGNSDRLCPAWAKSGMVLANWDGIEASVDRRPDKWNNRQVMARGTFGATRTQGKKIVKIICEEP
jgi:hypothetical protein